MALIAGIEFVTTFELYGNYVKGRVVVTATCLVVNQISIYLDFFHNYAKMVNDPVKKKVI